MFTEWHCIGSDTASAMASSLNGKIQLVLQPCKDQLDPSFDKIEETVAKFEYQRSNLIEVRTRAILLILTDEVLKIPLALWCIKCALFYKLRIILIHDNRWPFPSVQERPKFMENAAVFTDKVFDFCTKF